MAETGEAFIKIRPDMSDFESELLGASRWPSLVEVVQSAILFAILWRVW